MSADVSEISHYKRFENLSLHLGGPLVMSLKHRKRQIFKWLVRASHTHIWVHNITRLIHPSISGASTAPFNSNAMQLIEDITMKGTRNKL